MEQHSLLEKSQLHTSRAGYVDKAARLLSEYRNAAFVYFTAELSLRDDEFTAEADGERAIYYKLESELEGFLIMAPFYFGKQTARWVEQLRRYLDSHDWEGTIYAPEFRAKIETLDEANDSTTNVIARAILLDEFDHLKTQVVAAMAWDIASSMENAVHLREHWAHVVADPNVTIVGECTAEPSTVKVGEVVTFSASGDEGTGYYSYDWEGDDGLKSSNRQVKARYHTPGAKIANVCIHPVRLAGELERLFENRIYSQCSVTVLPSGK